MPYDANAMTQKGNVALHLDKKLVENSKKWVSISAKPLKIT
jgi:hypothetical protein